MRCLEHALSYDQLNVGELACMELLLRRAQLSELKHKERLLQVDAANDYGADEYLYMGTNSTRGQVMIAPELEEYVSTQLQKEGSVLKERRKLMEERALLRPARQGGQPSGGRGEHAQPDPKKKGRPKGGGRGEEA